LHPELVQGGVPEIRSLEDDTATDIHLVGFFRAFGSTLDCLAAVAIAVLRLDRSIQAASFRDIETLVFELVRLRRVSTEPGMNWSRDSEQIRRAPSIGHLRCETPYCIGRFPGGPSG
jgi:hypothetical protein